MLDDLFIPDPPAGDSSNRIADTRFVTNTIASTIVTAVSGGFPQISSLTVVANLSTVAATAVGTSLTNTIDKLIGSTPGSLLLRNNASWVTVASSSLNGAFVLINTLTANGVASVVDTSSFTSTYSSFKIVVVNMTVSIRGAAAYLQYHSGGAFQTANYTNAGTVISSDFVSDTIAGTTGALQLTSNATTATNKGIATTAIGLAGNATVFNPSVSSAANIIIDTNYQVGAGGGDCTLVHNAGVWNSSGVIDGFAVAVNTGVMTSIIKIYGIS